MSKLDNVIERIRQLPQERQDALAAKMEVMLNHDDGESLLTDEQWAEVQAELDDPNPELVPHEQVVAEFEKKYGR